MPKRENTSLSKVKKNASLKKVEKNASRLTVEKNTSLSKVEKNASRLPVEKSRSAVENSSLKKVERDIATKYGKMQTKLSDLITEFMVSIEGLKLVIKLAEKNATKDILTKGDIRILKEKANHCQKHYNKIEAKFAQWKHDIDINLSRDEVGKSREMSQYEKFRLEKNYDCFCRDYGTVIASAVELLKKYNDSENESSLAYSATNYSASEDTVLDDYVRKDKPLAESMNFKGDSNFETSEVVMPEIRNHKFQIFDESIGKLNTTSKQVFVSTIYESTPKIKTQETSKSKSKPNSHLESSCQEARHCCSATQPIINVSCSSERRKLPPVHDIPHFSGEADTFPEFWDYWKYHVHDVDAPVTDKLTSLKAVLKNGSAYSIVKNRRLTVADYNAVIQILHSQYGDSQEIISSWFDKLYNLEPPKEIEANQISDYANTLLSIKSQLDYYNTSIPGFMMLKIAKSLPLSLSEMVDLRCLYKHGSPYNMDDLVEALKNVAKKVQNVKGSQEQIQKNFETKNPQNKTLSCILCQENHKPSYCTKYQTREDRVNWIKSNKRCFKCLGTNHSTKECVKNIVCRICKLNHNTLLCYKAYKQEQPTQNEKTGFSFKTSWANSVQARKPEVKQVENNHIHDLSSEKESRFGCILTMLAGTNMKVMQQGVVFVDTGCKQNLLRKSVAQSLQLPLLNPNPLQIKTVSGSIPTEAYYSNIILIPIDTQGQKIEPINVEVTVVDDIILDEVNSGNLDKNIDVVLGIDGSHEIELKMTKSVGKSGFKLATSKLGSFESGALKTKSASITEINHMILVDEKEDDDPFKSLQNFELQKYCNWTDTMGITKEDSETKRESELNTFKFVIENTVQNEETGRYSVPLPFKDNSVDIENEFKRCFGRLHHIVQTLDKKPNLKTAYDKNFTDYLKLGIIEECEFHRSTDKTVRYIPHLPVERPGHPTTPVRNVFDGSAKDKNGISLNSCLNQGFTLLPEIPDIIIKSRKFKYLGIADLEKAFLMVEILEKYRDSVRFLWLKDITKPVTYSNIKIFRFKRVTFRLICSPSLLATVIHLHLSKYVEKIGTKSLKDILSMLYVDNLFLGSNDEEVLTKQALDLKSIFAEGAMNLREYSSNSKKLIDSFQEADIATRKILFLL